MLAKDEQKLRSAVRFGDIVDCHDRQRWLNHRKSTLGASEAADLFGVGYGSEYELWARFAHPELTEDDADNPSEAMLWGTRLQDAILEELADRKGWQVIAWPQHWRVVHPKLPLACTPDAIAWAPDSDAPFLVEVKHLNEFAARHWPRDDDGQIEASPAYQVQLQTQMLCTGIHDGCLAMLFGGQRMEVVHQRRHSAFQHRLLEVVEDFWRRVWEDDPPEVDGSEATKRTIYALHPEALGHAVDLPAEFDAIAEELLEVSAARLVAEKRERELKNRITSQIGDATFGVTASGVAFSWKQQKRDGIDASKLAAKYPDVYDDVHKLSKFRVLRSVKKVPDEVYANKGE